MTIQDLSALLSEGPQELLERTLDEYAELLRAEGLAAEHLEAIDYALRHTVVQVLARAVTEEELSEVYDALRSLVPVEREEELAAWAGRWRALADLVDAKLAVVAARRKDADVALRFKHADRVVELVKRSEGSSQAEIGERLGLKPANLSRILGVLEAHELIERRTVGREKRVYRGPLAAPVMQLARPESQDAVPRGRDLFRVA